MSGLFSGITSLFSSAKGNKSNASRNSSALKPTIVNTLRKTANKAQEAAPVGAQVTAVSGGRRKNCWTRKNKDRKNKSRKNRR
jgi:hypothetical protein